MCELIYLLVLRWAKEIKLESNNVLESTTLYPYFGFRWPVVLGLAACLVLLLDINKLSQLNSLPLQLKIRYGVFLE